MVKIGIVQMKTCENKEMNINKAKEGIEQCVKKGAQIIILPEIFNSPYDTKKFREFSEEEKGKTWSFLSNMAKENKIILIGGSIPEKEKDNIYNTSFIFNEEGSQIAKHRKMHLFDIDIEGGQHFKESESLTAGDSICVFNTRFCKIGVCICFDMRFPELSRLMVLKGAEIIIVPAAFNMTTGPPHWEIMFRQRAVDNQCFTIGVAPARNNESSYISYANSIIVNPWGSVIYEAKEKECFDVIEINLNEVKSIRKQLPLLSARRTDIYIMKENDEIKKENKISYNYDSYITQKEQLLKIPKENIKKMNSFYFENISFDEEICNFWGNNFSDKLFEKLKFKDCGFPRGCFFFQGILVHNLEIINCEINLENINDIIRGIDPFCIKIFDFSSNKLNNFEGELSKLIDKYVSDQWHADIYLKNNNLSDNFRNSVNKLSNVIFHF